MKKILVKDENGFLLAVLYYNGSTYQVVREPMCSLGTFFYILSYLQEQDIPIS